MSFAPNHPFHRKNSLLSTLNGLLIINKPKTWTSFDVVAKIRKQLNIKKVGHTGTLDPMATGVLVLCLGKATKLAQKLTGLDKEYVAEITLGARSNTDDAEGEIVKNLDAEEKNKSEIETTLKQFEGVIQQIPPKFSAKKINGKRAYHLARKGKEVELKPVEVSIKKIELLDYKWPLLKIRVECGKGTYIRSLARDIGEKLETGAYLSELERTKVGEYNITQAKKIEEAGEEYILKVNVF